MAAKAWRSSMTPSRVWPAASPRLHARLGVRVSRRQGLHKEGLRRRAPTSAPPERRPRTRSAASARAVRPPTATPANRAPSGALQDGRGEREEVLLGGVPCVAMLSASLWREVPRMAREVFSGGAAA
jgi:hypothetical protein